MSKDIFGYTKDVHGPGNIVTAPMVMVAITKGSKSTIVRLAQNVNITYQRQAQPVHELGSDSVWFNAGGATGNISIGRAIGSASNSPKFMQPYTDGDPCNKHTIVVQGGSNDCANLNPGTITAEGVLTNVTANFQAGATSVITDGAQYTIGKLSIG